MNKFKIGDNVFITSQAQDMLGLPDGVEYFIDDILEGSDIEYIYCLKTEDFGKDWVQFFSEDELILIEE